MSGWRKKQIETLELALEALEKERPYLGAMPNMTSNAITAIKEALAQPEQEPVAWKETDEVECPVCKDKGFPWPKCGHITHLEPTPPQRTWVGLTKYEHDEILITSFNKVHHAIKLTQDKLKEKNT